MHRLQLTALVRVIALLLALLWCVQPLGLAVHASQHAHRFCAEHGAVEEGPADAADTAPAHIGAPHQEDGTGSPLDPQAPGGHEECSVVSAVPAGLLPEAVASTVGLLLAEAPVPLPSPRAAFHSVALLHVAPKGSPPALLPPVPGPGLT